MASLTGSSARTILWTQFASAQGAVTIAVERLKSLGSSADFLSRNQPILVGIERVNEWWRSHTWRRANRPTVCVVAITAVARWAGGMEFFDA